ncbi:MAG TPA: transglutaminase-like domain-containing protein [Vicinamibacterales bacterium]|nr:transglutaminase-like domain-containing protein [Vicinamibacterales bacterium]
MPFSLHLQARTAQVAAALQRAMATPGDDLASAALTIAHVEYPALEQARYLDQLDKMGSEASARLGGRTRSTEEAVGALNEYLFDEQGFSGNRDQYDDPRNSFINDVLDRRTGIPISLAVVYLEVARRAGVQVTGVNFPGHFLLRAPYGPSGGTAGRIGDRSLIIDPFHGGARLSEQDCRELLRQHVGDDVAFDETLLAPATRHDVVVRMLVNLKRLYVRMRSFPQARLTADLLLSVDPSAITELRDRGLLAYHLQDFAAALRDLEAYLRLLPKGQAPADEADDAMTEGADAQEESEDAQIWEHVKSLRRRVAGFN